MSEDKKSCEACNGTGKVIDSNEGGERACKRCGGTGQIEPVGPTSGDGGDGGE